jgi:hypothetical protein
MSALTAGIALRGMRINLLREASNSTARTREKDEEQRCADTPASALDHLINKVSGYKVSGYTVSGYTVSACPTACAPAGA